MDEDSSTPTLLESKNTIISKDLSAYSVCRLNGFLKRMGFFYPSLPPQYDTKDSFSEFSRGCLKVQHIHRGNISCLLSVKPAIMNIFGSLHGGAVAAVTVRVATACAQTIVGKNKELFLGDLSMTFLSGAPGNGEIIVNASSIRSVRNLTLVAVAFRVKDSEKLVYVSHATLYHMPIASL